MCIYYDFHYSLDFPLFKIGLLATRNALLEKTTLEDWRSGGSIGLTIAGQNDYCDTITIVKNPIAILLLLQLPIAILLR